MSDGSENLLRASPWLPCSRSGADLARNCCKTLERLNPNRKLETSDLFDPPSDPPSFELSYGPDFADDAICSLYQI
ncbi:hypothetical protein COLO4_36781 [Corchorus olitorius]|uniref:Uncharacterized protein n=1 Tax=Corchorus olitorius TaxID=93759 RepID=A0A1R3G5E7_9ROSI|nr:hypothetical protein COLO4_36781 [Corchorus olitorius]